MHVKKVEIVNLEKEEHTEAVIVLLNEYMRDDMGWGKEMPTELAPKIIEGLKSHKAFIGFLALVDNKYAGLAICNINYSTWSAKFLLNVHDFVVHSEYRKRGLGKFLLAEIEKYAIENGFCKLNLEVREDNRKAQSLYEYFGFRSTNPNMLFWEKVL